MTDPKEEMRILVSAAILDSRDAMEELDRTHPNTKAIKHGRDAYLELADEDLKNTGYDPQYPSIDMLKAMGLCAIVMERLITRVDGMTQIQEDPIERLKYATGVTGTKAAMSLVGDLLAHYGERWLTNEGLPMATQEEMNHLYRQEEGNNGSQGRI